MLLRPLLLLHVIATTTIGNHDCSNGDSDSGGDGNPRCCRLVFSQLVAVAVKRRWMIMVLPSSSPSSATQRHRLACRWNKEQGGRRRGILTIVLISLQFSGDSLSFCGLQIDTPTSSRSRCGCWLIFYYVIVLLERDVCVLHLSLTSYVPRLFSGKKEIMIKIYCVASVVTRNK